MNDWEFSKVHHEAWIEKPLPKAMNPPKKEKKPKK